MLPRRTRSPAPAADAPPAVAYTYPSQTRKNIPPAGLAAQGRVREVAKHAYSYDPHLPPALRSDPTGGEDVLPELVAAATTRPLTEDEARLLAAGLRQRQPWLEWSTKREAPRCVVDPVALQVHERVSAQAVLKAAQRERAQRDLFADPRQPYREALQFYQHDVGWANRLILGDSLQVMASLARREDLAGKVQMIYLDPPYGIKFASNFQSEVGRRDVKDKEQDLTREPEMVKAYRDTWTLGVHSYLAYLRDRLLLAKELLADTGSIFVQISDENLHRVRCVMDEVFGAENACGTVVFRKTTGKASALLDPTYDVLLWYARERVNVKYRQPFEPRTIEDDYNLRWVELPNGEQLRLGTIAEMRSTVAGGARAFRPNPLTSQTPSETTRFGVQFAGARDPFTPGARGWSTNLVGMERLRAAERLIAQGRTLSFVRFLDDFAHKPANNIWDDTRQSGFGDEKRYVVQTSTRVIERCMLMTTDPGDLVFDPTCGSGTTAVVAEQWGRRWITVDTSRVAVSIARQRLLTATYDYYRLRGEVPNGTTHAGGGVARRAASSTRRFRTLRSRASRRTPRSTRSSPGTSPRSMRRWRRSTPRCVAWRPPCAPRSRPSSLRKKSARASAP